ncbi:MAG: tetratricopeptide repeat protein [Pyrinomonadaceae bacterium]|nr:tetratricopeptide repeat protein [Pyrinomonadaceae bacterium]
MAEDVFKIPKSLKIALKEKRVVPFVGAGASIPVRKRNADGAMSDESLFLSWKDFIEFLIQGLRDENRNDEAEFIQFGLKTKRMTYLDALQQIQQILGKNLWYELFEKSFGFLESDAHPDSFKLNRLIWELSNNLIITTNIDRVLHWACPKPLDFNLLNVQKVKFAQLQNEKTIKRPTVWHLHGHIDHIEEIIFTRDQFESFYKQKDNEAKFQTLISFLTQRTFVFIGFSLDDDYLRELLKYVHDTYEGGAGSYYILFRKRDIASANFPDYVTPIPFADFGKPLEDLVEELARIAKEDDDKREEKSIDGNTQSPDETKKDAQESFFNVPYRSKGDEFVGRVGKIDEILEKLSNNGCAAIGQAVSVKGFGGLGKTQLAVEFAHAYKDRYKNGVYWLVADSNIENQIVQIADERKWINKDDKSINQIEVAKDEFKKLSECLILVDNVEAFDDVKDYLPKTDSHTHLLITSREKDGRFHEIDIDLLNRDESRELLQKVSKRNPTDENEKAELEKILEILGDIPLAVELVGGFLKEHKDISFGEYLGYLENVPLSELEEEFPKSSFTSHDHSIIRTLRISEKTIEKNPLLVEILKVLAWSGRSSMSVSLLKDLIAPDNDFKFRIALSDAVNLRLINKDEDGERYTIHRLLAKVIRFEQSLEKQIEWLTKIAENLEKWFDDRKEEFNYLADFEAETEHLTEWQKNTIKYLPEKAIWFVALESYPLWQRGNYKEAFQFLEKSFGLYESKKIDNHALLANLNNDLGVIYGALGNYQKALEYQEKALELQKELFGEKHPSTALSYSNVGLTYGALGNHQKALEYKEKALELRKELFGEKHPSTATSYNNVGGTYGELGNHRKALEYLEKALELRKELFGEKHPLTALSYSNVGGTYGDLGNHRKALEYKEKALELRKELFGEKHPSTALSYNNVGLTYGALGNHQKALEYKEKALELQKELFGEKHPSTATSYNNVGLTYGDLGEHQKALEYFENALDIHQNILGKQHPNSIFIARNLIITYLNLGNNLKAREKLLEYFYIVPQNNPHWKWFEEESRPYRPNKNRQKKKKRR